MLNSPISPVIYAYLYSAGRTDDYKVVNLEFGNYLICKKK